MRGNTIEQVTAQKVPSREGKCADESPAADGRFIKRGVCP